MARQDGSEEGVVDVLRTTELRKSKPEDNNRLEKVIECYHSQISKVSLRSRRKGFIRSQYKIVLDQYSTTLKNEKTTQYVNH